MSAIDHVSLGIRNPIRAKAFYDAVLAPLGLAPVMPIEIAGRLRGVGYGHPGPHPAPQFWIQEPLDGREATQGNGAHIAFAAKTRADVDAFYLAAMERGGTEDGRPGLREDYHPNYYAAFVRDPDGNKIEACCHAPE